MIIIIWSLLTMSLSFPVNERLNYQGFYGPLRVGSSYMQILSGVDLDGKKTYKIESEQKTEGLFSLIYRLSDYYCSYVDTLDFTSIKFIKNIEEGGYKNSLTLNFTEDSVLYSDGKRTEKIKNARDIFTALYYIRNLNLESGDTVDIPFHSSGRNQIMKVPVSGPVKVKVPNGEYETLLLAPSVEEGKLFGSSKPIKIWVTDNPLHIPVRIESELSVGKIKFLLSGIEVIKR